MSLDLPWLAAPWMRAAQALASGRLPAGLLILGQPGLGRKRLAKAIAQARLCPQPQANREACGACTSCRQVQAGSHPDLLTVQPEEDKKTISIDQIRELTGALALTAGQQGARCAILAPADRMTAQAANALLKTLEEPAPGVTLILIATTPGALPVTVLSRCLRLAVPIPENEKTLAWLAGRAVRDDWPMLLALAAGAPLAAERLAGEGIDDVNRLVTQIVAVAAGRADPLAVTAQYSDWPLVRLAALIAWLTQHAFRNATLPSVLIPGPFGELAALAAHADRRVLSEVWREANVLTVEDTALNAPLARERLVLLFASAFRHPAGDRNLPARARGEIAATRVY